MPKLQRLPSVSPENTCVTNREPVAPVAVGSAWIEFLKWFLPVSSPTS